MTDDLQAFSKFNQDLEQHHPLCKAHGRHFWPVTFDGTPFLCDCELIAKVEERHREEIADAIRDVAFHVYLDTDGYRSIKVHNEHEGLTLAEQLVRKWGSDA